MLLRVTECQSSDICRKFLSLSVEKSIPRDLSLPPRRSRYLLVGNCHDCSCSLGDSGVLFHRLLHGDFIETPIVFHWLLNLFHPLFNRIYLSFCYIANHHPRTLNDVRRKSRFSCWQKREKEWYFRNYCRFSHINCKKYVVSHTSECLKCMLKVNAGMRLTTFKFGVRDLYGLVLWGDILEVKIQIHIEDSPSPKQANGWVEIYCLFELFKLYR